MRRLPVFTRRSNRGGRLIIIEFRRDGVVGSVTRMGIDRAELTEAVTTAGFDVEIGESGRLGSLCGGVHEAGGNQVSHQLDGAGPAAGGSHCPRAWLAGEALRWRGYARLI